MVAAMAAPWVDMWAAKMVAWMVESLVVTSGKQTVEKWVGTMDGSLADKKAVEKVDEKVALLVVLKASMLEIRMAVEKADL